MKNLKKIKGADELPEFLTEDWIEQAMKKLDKSQMTSEQRMNYEMMMARNASKIQIITEEERKEAEKKGIMIGEKKGIIIGEKKGIMKGEKKGEKKGVIIGKKIKAKNTAKKLKEFGIETKIIAESTGLTEKEIEEL